MFKDELVSCTMVNGNVLIFMNKILHLVLKAFNRGTYVYTARKAFESQPSLPSQINWTQLITIDHRTIDAMSVAATVKPGQFWAMQAMDLYRPIKQNGPKKPANSITALVILAIKHSD